MNDLITTDGATRPRRETSQEPKLPASGEYWRYVAKPDGTDEHAKTRAIPTGRILLVEKVESPDGIMHSVKLSPHPTEDWGWSYLIGEFLDEFEYAPNGAAERQAEVREVEVRINELQRRLASPPEMPPQALLTTGSGPVDAKLTDLIIQGVSVASLQEQTRQMSQALTIHAENIRAITKSMGEETTLLASFYGERARASLAEVADTIAYADHLQKGVATLGLYAGENVTVETLVDGEPAADERDGRIRIHQRQLYMDEELLIRLEEGGADYTNDREFAQMLRDDPVLRDRIIPGRRSIVLMRYRRHQKNPQQKYGESPIEAALRSIEEDQANRQSFLLVRNGDRIQAVYADRALFGLDRLFPRAKDISDVYKDGRSWRGIESREITVADLEYPKHREKFEELALAYRRVLVTLWGLDNRLDLFGLFYDRRRHPTMLSMTFQEEHLEFVDDDEAVLTEARPNFSAWMAEKNLLMQPGSRVAVSWNDAMTYKSAPGAVREETTREGRTKNVFLYSPVERTGITVVRKSRNGMSVLVECRYQGYSDVKREIRNFEVNLEAARSSEGRFSILCLDGVTSAELDWYIHSRGERESYLKYIKLFIAARRHLAAEEERQAGMVDHLVGIVGNLGHADDAARPAVDKSVRDWRAIRNGAELPAVDEAGSAGVIKAIVHYASLSLRGDPQVEMAVDRIRQDAETSGRRVLSIEADMDGRFDVVLTHSDEEAPTILQDKWRLVGKADRLGRVQRLEHRVMPPSMVGRVQIVREDDPPVTGRSFAKSDYARTMAVEAYVKGEIVIPGIEMLRGGGHQAATAFVLECMDSKDHFKVRSAWTRMFVPIALVHERKPVRQGMREEIAPLAIHGIQFTPIHLVATLDAEARGMLVDRIGKRLADGDFWNAHLDSLKIKDLFHATAGSVSTLFDGSAEIQTDSMTNEYDRGVTDPAVFDDRDAFVANMKERRRFRHEESEMRVMHWHPDADLMMSIVRRITQGQ